MSRTSSNVSSLTPGKQPFTFARNGDAEEEEEEEEDEEEFVYPGAAEEEDSGATSAPSEVPATHAGAAEPASGVSSTHLDAPSTSAPGAMLTEASPVSPLPPPPSAAVSTADVSPTPPPRQASPAQLEALYAAASSGDLPLLERTIRNASQSANVEPFSLVNGASSRTGLTALHAAASRGFAEIVQWLVEKCGAIPDLEDKEGELHCKAI
ncbi:hypothetical protein BV25DRAFT_67095 [Artomyces pyxidatus]|uniref:Uncharacterized protein n=1 Tax=Artomyces pyxidatus TaxID=48021 RepID=A0ACB8TKH7_9AGAM|nr:hypothetical protein BV25DRAFT_67095 [Artomyces pyxidatus]